MHAVACTATLAEVPLRQFLVEMSDVRRRALLAIWDEYETLFRSTPGSSHNHQAWLGGYADHLAETFRFNRCLYQVLSGFRPVPFTEDQAIVALFFHDIEKPFKYGDPADPLVQQCVRHAEKKWDILGWFMARYQFRLSPAEVNAIEYAHGEGEDYREDGRVMWELAAHVHHCDNISARIFHQEGRGLA